MLEAGITYRDPDLLLYTHLHPDHTADLVPTLFACKYGDLPREKNLLCMGGPGFKSFFKKLKELYGPWVTAQSYHLTIKEISKETIRYRDLKIFSRFIDYLRSHIYIGRQWSRNIEKNVRGGGYLS